MAHPIYYVPAGDVLPVFFDTYDGGTGASITMTGLAVTDIEIYKDGSTTQRASDAGYTLLDTDGIDFDGVTGIHGFSIDTGDNTDASFYTVGAWFTVVVSAITVDAQTVSFVACQFRLMPAEAVAGKPKVDVDAWLGTAAATPSVAGVPEVDLTHVGGATTNVSALATNVDAILTDTGTSGVLISSGTGTGQIQLSGGIADANLRQWIGVAPLALTSQHVQSSVAAMQTGVITAAATAADCIDASALATDAVTEIVNAIKAAVVESEGSYTIQQVLSICLAVLAGQTSNSGNTIATPNGNATRVAATVSSNTRTAMTLTPSS